MVYAVHLVTSGHAEILYTFHHWVMTLNKSLKSTMKPTEHPLITHFMAK